jgi:CheY-like chemotaxis protein
MAEYNLSCFSVLVVENNRMVRELLCRMLRRLGVGRVTGAGNGEEATALLHKPPANQLGAVPPGFDVIVSDLFMTPVDGLQLLRWVRTHPASFNPFIPFVMLSGTTEPAVVAEARNAGVTEFLAKPVNAKALAQRLLSLIDHPRQFVCTQEYFGPDRRRRDAPPGTAERRIIAGDNVAVAYSEGTLRRPEKGHVWLYRLPNRLKEKAGGLGSRESGFLSPYAVSDAADEAERMGAAYIDWISKHLAYLLQACDALARSPAKASNLLGMIRAQARELMGEGGSFGYSLVGTVAASLYEAAQESSAADPETRVHVLRAHVEAMAAIITQRLTGDGGAAGAGLVAGLKRAVAKPPASAASAA